MDAPLFILSKFPPEDRDLAWHVECKFLDLQQHTEAFHHAVLLMDEMEPRSEAIATAIHSNRPSLAAGRWRFPAKEMAELKVLKGWIHMAARDAAFSVYHLRAAIHSIIANVEKCPSLAKAVDFTKLEEARDDLPEIVELRHAVAHKADDTYSIEKVRKNSIDGVRVSGDLYGRTLTYTRAGTKNPAQLHALSITDDQFARLCAIKDKVFAAFPPIYPAMKTN